MENNRVKAMGYTMIGKQSDKDTAVVPTVGLDIQSGIMTTDDAKHESQTIRGNRFRVQNVYTGRRSHTGTISILMEPNTVAYIMDMLFTKGTTTGSDPYTHPFTVGNTENYYTVEQFDGKYVTRFQGVKALNANPTLTDSIYYLETSLVGLKSFSAVELSATPTGSGPAWTAVFETGEFDQDPSACLVVGDTLIFDDGTTETEADITSINADGVTVEVDADVTSYGAGDTVRLKEQTPTYSLRQPFKWGRTEFRFGADATAALSAALTEVDEGSAFTLVHSVEDDAGASTAGSKDPTDIRRTLADATLTITKVFETEEDLADFKYNDKSACVVRMFSENEDLEFRVTLNNLRGKTPQETDAGDTITKLTQEFSVAYDNSDAQAFDVKVINKVSSI